MSKPSFATHNTLFQRILLFPLTLLTALWTILHPASWSNFLFYECYLATVVLCMFVVNM